FAISPKVVYQKVGNLSPKGCVGDSRLAPVSRWQSVSKPVRNTNCPIESDSPLPIGNATFRRKVAYLLIHYLWRDFK
ncbi:MAG: hypothetical protein LBG58_14845, partial [Planctomycetaceae bacterium]|nr:hypothetical protein [Planctomycetaceae bacterium]